MNILISTRKVLIIVVTMLCTTDTVHAMIAVARPVISRSLLRVSPVYQQVRTHYFGWTREGFHEHLRRKYAVPDQESHEDTKIQNFRKQEERNEPQAALIRVEKQLEEQGKLLRLIVELVEDKLPEARTLPVVEPEQQK